MGSTEEATKDLNSGTKVSKKLNFDVGESEESLMSNKDPLENGLEDDDHTYDKSSSEKDDSDEDGTMKLPEMPDSLEVKDNKKATPNMDIQGARARNDSESSSTSGHSPVDRMKRQRTVSESSPVQNFIFPGVAASPPKFMSLEEVMKAANGVSNMVLAHEIAVDKNFKLEKFEPPEDSLERKVRDTMHKAFWDNLAEQLKEDPPDYTQAFVLLQEVRDNLLEITLPHHTRLRQEINEKFDVELIKQQAEHGVLNFEEYSQYVLFIMARLCAPVRDEVIQGLMKEKDIVTIFRGVMETLDFMRLDMANFTIQQIRPHIIAQSVEYERKKFTEFLKTQNDGLEITRNWLTQFIQPEDMTVTDDLAMRSVFSRVISRAYLNLLSWPDEKLLPETVVLDGSRIFELRDRMMQVCLMGATILVTLSSLGPILPHADVLKMKLKKNICGILDPAYTQQETYDLMENIAEQVIKDVSDHLKEHDKPPLPQSAVSVLKSQLLEIKNPDQRVRELITNRANEFIGFLLSSTTARPVQVPPGLSALQEELAHICGTLLRLVSHNRAVFGEYYAEIIQNHIKGSNTLHALCSETQNSLPEPTETSDKDTE
ncbi:T-complex protein 11-like protein 1 [Armadillidium nasatum]|uniref:T-complex protein 11-like protein 1 n=1 Tax=Armadillidium nasatum TaxID=96803 RepID=A0A5N5SWH0_9CRUS|nr:T-complex protein 11-like protein 1 [Armadillidium nasatum]